ncbi:MAG: polymerase sigma factor [Verrucomicrobiales bacterium]|nr:polymerase sigma factor [Verrucomicrobiales bacterium]
MDSDSKHDGKFLELLRENRPKILKICRVYAWDAADQEDLYQEILFQIWRALPSLKAEHYANTWVYRIALNTALSFVRKDKSRRAHLSAGGGDQLHEVPEDLSSNDPHKNEQLTQLFQAISQLNGLEKAAITLFLEDLSYQEIAAIMGITEGNVGVMLHRAKKKLSTFMKEAPCTTTL